MATVTKRTDKHGDLVYYIRASDGMGRRISRSWKPERSWSEKTIERELARYCSKLEEEFEAKELLTVSEQEAQEHKEAIERAQLKTVHQYCAEVYMPTKAVTCSENTRYNYELFLKGYIYPAIGEQLLTEVSPAMLKSLITNYQRGRAHASAVKLYNILNGIFEMAFLDDSIPINPMLKVPRPKPRKNEKVKDSADLAYTAEEAAHILECLEQEPLKWKVYVSLLIDSGLRRGEATALTWENVNFKDGYITVRQNAQYTADKGVYIDTPKNGKVRRVDVGEQTLSLLHQLRVEQGKTVGFSKWVFTQEGSTEMMHPQSPTHYFKQFGKRYGIKDFHPHKLRHSYASIAITNGADVVSVSERLGHSDTAVTLRMYAHANEESIRRAGQIARDAIMAVK